MKRNIDKPDYRSMDEVQLKHELAGLEQRILGITAIPSTTSTTAGSLIGAGTR